MKSNCIRSNCCNCAVECYLYRSGCCITCALCSVCMNEECRLANDYSNFNWELAVGG
jgi:hypothetical protein